MLGVCAGESQSMCAWSASNWCRKGGLTKFRASNWGHTGGVGTPGLVVLASGSGGVWCVCSVCIFPKPGVPGGVCVTH